ncbi:ABC transporter ATP-binding protein [Nocardioides albidus]|uniref:ABC transporter ATP-binding protein n=1 Tax=Nocardioides albidus TaxID=1517589 RepID=A0A5C4VL01_9ACTN|nr:ABC transporter ATP-binding protein [Nocardioides albidus]TNM36518.1 ABC transporter ATP-binding protein [Nocardioides albidus]
MSEPTTSGLLEVEDLCVSFGHGSGAAHVLDHVSLSVPRGRTVGLVGESGSGKSTLAKAVVGIVTPRSGSIRLAGADVTSMSRKEIFDFRRTVQLVPQDPYSSLNPRRTIGQSLAEAIDPRRAQVSSHRERIAQWLELVRLSPDHMHRYPHEFSGGQRQRIAIARALVVEPSVVIADEITSALDVSVQAEILELVARIRDELDLTMVFISHNLAVVRQVCDDVTVLFHGKVVESGPSAQVFESPRDDYTRRLLASVPGSATFSLD